MAPSAGGGCPGLGAGWGGVRGGGPRAAGGGGLLGVVWCNRGRQRAPAVRERREATPSSRGRWACAFRPAGAPHGYRARGRGRRYCAPSPGRSVNGRSPPPSNRRGRGPTREGVRPTHRPRPAWGARRSGWGTGGGVGDGFCFTFGGSSLPTCGKCSIQRDKWERGGIAEEMGGDLMVTSHCAGLRRVGAPHRACRRGVGPYYAGIADGRFGSA